MSLFLILFWLALLACAAAAVRWGGSSERAVATMYVTAGVVTILARPTFEARYQGVELSILAVDLMLFLGLAAVAARVGLWWTICAAALQCLTVLGHVGKMLNPHLLRLGYQLMATWAAWPAVALLGIGVWQHARRLRRTG